MTRKAKRPYLETIEHKYKYRYKEDDTRNICVYEIQRDVPNQDPYTVIVYDFARLGHRQLFNDIFWCDSWDSERDGTNEISSDIKFLIGLWEELGLVEETGEQFHPKHIEHDLLQYPTIYRRPMEEVMARKYGNANVQFVDSIAPVTDSVSTPSTPAPVVIPLTFDINDTDMEIEHKIKKGIADGMVL